MDLPGKGFIIAVEHNVDLHECAVKCLSFYFYHKYEEPKS